MRTTMLALLIAAVSPCSLLFAQELEPKNPPAVNTHPDNHDTAAAEWLVDLARHEGHLLGRGGSARSASLHVIALLEAARYCNPNYAETYQWLYDLYHRMGRAAPAREVLARYVELAPQDEPARQRLLELELETRQTAEQRLEFLRKELDRSSLTPFYESELRRRLARHFFESMDRESAVREIETALRLNPMNVAARELSYEMFNETEPALQRVEMALQLVAVNPSQAGLIWDLAEFLDRLSLHKQAQEWFSRAIDVHRLSNSRPIPADYWQKLAASHIAGGDYEQARRAIDAAVAADPEHFGARLLRARILKELGEEQKAVADLDEVHAAYEKLLPLIEGGAKDRSAEAAWYYAYHRPDKEKSLRLAGIAMDQPKTTPLARLAHGYALRLNGKTSEAVDVLTPLAATDQLAALELGRALADRGEKARAIQVLQKAAAIQYSGITFEQIVDLLAELGAETPAAPSQEKIVKALARFPRDVFDFYKKPGAFLKCSLRIEPVAHPLAPVRITLRLENDGPFTITLGEGFMIRPLAAISGRVVTRQKTTEFKNYLQVLINSRPLLAPGEAIEKSLSIDVGPIRELLVQNILEPVTVQVYALIDPVYENGQLVAGLGTISIAAVESNRPRIENSEQTVKLLIDQCRDRHAAARIDAAQGIAALIFATRDAAGPAKSSADQLTAALIELLKDPDWRVRARAIAACDALRLDRKITDAAAPAVNDEHAVVKMLGVRLFAPKHGKGFLPVLEQLSKNDPSTCVRMMAASFLPEPATARASAEPVGP